MLGEFIRSLVIHRAQLDLVLWEMRNLAALFPDRHPELFEIVKHLDQARALMVHITEQAVAATQQKE